MILCADTMNISFRSWEREEDMRGSLSDCDQETILLGEDADQMTDFHSLRVFSDWNGLSRFGIGICSEGHGLEPHFLVHPERNRLIVGFNSQVVAIDLRKRKIAFQIRLSSLFRSFSPLKAYQMFLVFHEIGVMALTEDGDEIWRFDEDIIDDCVMENGTLSLSFLDAKPVMLDMLSGTLKIEERRAA